MCPPGGNLTERLTGCVRHNVTKTCQVAGGAQTTPSCQEKVVIISP